MRHELNLFSLHGDYYQNNENRLTANAIFLLSEFRHLLMPPLLDRLSLSQGVRRDLDLASARFVFQEAITTLQGLRRPDAEIRLDKLRIVVEAKVGSNPLDGTQLREYAEDLRDSGPAVKRLLCITQAHDRENFEAIAKIVEPAILPRGSMVYLRWYELLDIIKTQVGLDRDELRKIARRIADGRTVPYSGRLCALFLDEVEKDMYDKRYIDDLPARELPDLVLSNQTAWFMRAARQFRVWFPKGGVRQPNPAKYVAYYEICDGGNEHPKEIHFVARNRIWWNQLTLEDALREEELKHVFQDKQLRDEIKTWNTFNIVLTDEPVELTRPLKLGKKSWAAKLMPLHKVDLPSAVNAATVDDLF